MPTPIHRQPNPITDQRDPINPKWPLPYWSSHEGRGLIRLYHGNVTDVLETLPAKSVHCVVTSPPYWDLRDYGTGTWEGGNPKCTHMPNARPRDDRPKGRLGGTTDHVDAGNKTYRDLCSKCGARRTDHQIGSEPSPDCSIAGQAMCGKCHICVIRNVFRSVRRVLRDDGVLWLNYGDTYRGVTHKSSDEWEGTDGMFSRKIKQFTSEGTHNLSMPKSGLPNGNLVGIPWRVALALQADGWVLRSDIPWVKTAPMPESVTNRPAKALEYVFMLTKSMDYFSDFEAVRKRATPAERVVTGKSGSAGQAAGKGIKPSGNGVPGSVIRTGDTRNFWSADLWYESMDKPYGLVGVGDELVGINVSPGSYAGAHFATFGVSLIEPLIKAGTSEKGCCPQCGNPWKRVLRSTASARVDRPSKTDTSFGPNPSQTHRPNGSEYKKNKTDNPTKTLGWHPTCRCGVGKPPVPCVVLDPFMGSGTTGEVCLKLGRAAVGIELNEEYLQKNAIVRINRAWHTYQHGREVHKGKL